MEAGGSGEGVCSGPVASSSASAVPILPLGNSLGENKSD